MRNSDMYNILYHRSRERIFCQDWYWFIDTREGRRGPFPNRNAAQSELTFFLDTITFLEQHKGLLPENVQLHQIDLVKMDQPTGWTDAGSAEVKPIRPGPDRTDRRR